jgi:hypothetical protein
LTGWIPDDEAGRYADIRRVTEEKPPVQPARPWPFPWPNWLPSEEQQAKE